MADKIQQRFLNLFREPYDLLSGIQPLHIVSTIVGLAPYSNKRLENGKRTYYFDFLPLIRSILQALVFLGALSYFIYESNAPFTDKDQDFKQKIRYLQGLFSAIFTFSSIIICCWFVNSLLNMFKNIEEVDIAFKELAVYVPYKKMHVAIILSLIVLGIHSLLTSITSCYFGVSAFPLEPKGFLYTSVMIISTSIWPYILNLLMEMQYVHYLSILKDRYKLLNDYLEALVNEKSEKVYNAWIEDNPISVVMKKQSPDLKKPLKIPKALVSITDPVFVVDQVALLHIKLTDTAHLINNCFCVQQLMRIAIAFVSIVTALFTIAMKFSNSKNMEDDMAFDIYFTFWAFSNALEVVVIVWITSETCEEANTCPRILHKIRNNTTNVKLQDTIEIYSLQLYHNRLYFTVCGLFPLDYTLLYTIVAGITTYLVILIQFNIEFVTKTNSTNPTIIPTTAST